MIGQLLRITGFELRIGLRRISTWVYFGILFALGLVLMMAEGGAWESFDSGGGGRLANSPLEITSTLSALTLLTLPITAALFGNAVFRDFQTRMHSLFFTAPISRTSYLGGRYLGAVLVNLLILSGAGLGMAIASAMPLLKPERVGPFVPLAYLQSYAFLILPNLLFTGGILFALAAFTRQMLPNYIGGVALLIGYTIAQDQMGDLESRETAALLDPLGMAAGGLTTRYWTVAERNVRLFPFEELFWQNRAIWLAVTLVILALLVWRFRFSHAGPEAGFRRWKPAGTAPEPVAPTGPVVLPPVRLRYDFAAHRAQFLSTARREFRSIVRNVYFAALVGVGLIFSIFMVSQAGEIYDTTTYPVTYSVLESVTGGFALFVIIILTFYAGELVWNERELRVSQLHDATPVAGWVPFTAKLAALTGVIAVLIALVALVALVTQVVQGYYRFELEQYVSTLFVRTFFLFFLFAVLALTVQVVVNHKYAGHFVMILYYIGTPIANRRLGWEHVLVNFGSGGDTIYSDMNRWGDSWAPWAWTNLYWAAFAVLLAIASNLLWVRGEEGGTAWRMRLARARASRPVRIAAGFACLLLVFTGGFVFYNANVLNEYRSSRDVERMQADFEKRYSRYEGTPQPRIVGVDVEVDIYPSERDLAARGVYRLVNRTRQPLDSVHVNYPADATEYEFSFSRATQPVLRDDERGYHIYRLAQPLAPGDSLRLTWRMEYDTEGFGNSVDEGGVAHNGTFFHHDRFPTIGYTSHGELSDDDVRERYGLRPKESAPPPTDSAGRMNPDISSDADWIDFAATVSTEPDQIAMAPGYLTREWTEGGRRYFRYEMDTPILHFLAFQSARYEVRRDRWRDVAIEIYHHPGHDYNLDRMVRATKAALDYFTTHFGTYPHRQMRIVEFPRYQSFAQSFPNTVPFSEGVGFIAKVDPDDVDYVFHTTAHEVAHQWWGHQAVGGAVQGSVLLSESLSEYSALMVMEKEYGQEGIKKFLRYELEGYLTGRAAERRKEVPLVRMAPEQMYLRYNKGALALYALRDHIGEDRLNGALRAFLEEVRYQQPPYTNSLELLAHLRAATPDSLRYLITDLFEEVTLYENRAPRATYERAPDGRYLVDVEVQARKLRADSLGNETEVPMRDWVDVGVFAAARKGSDEKLGPPLYLRKHRLNAGRQVIRVPVSQPPARAGVDPYHRLIDRQMSDNTVAVKEK